jgi:hypothetical protein
LVDAIECASGIDVEVVIDPQRARQRSEEHPPLACAVTSHAAQIITATAECFPDSSVMHELLHIQRFHVQRVPRIVASEEAWPRPHWESSLFKLDNGLEHLVIVPDELSRQPARRQYWRDVILRSLGEIKEGHLSTADKLRWALLNGAFAVLVLDEPALITEYRGLAESLGGRNGMDRFIDALGPVLNSKEAMVLRSFEHLQLPLGDACLEYFGPRRGQSNILCLDDVVLS